MKHIAYALILPFEIEPKCEADFLQRRQLHGELHHAADKGADGKSGEPFFRDDPGLAERGIDDPLDVGGEADDR